MRPTPAELRAAHGRTVPDLLGPGVRLLFVGINPGLWSGATGAHFARPGNRFFPALHAAGLTGYVVDASAGLSEADRAHLLSRGIGITNLHPLATARADEVSDAELREGVARLTRLVAEFRPAVVAVAGITAYRTAFRRPRAMAGRQGEVLADAELWVVPNPSGLNAHETVASLAAAYAEVAAAAGIDPLED
ncbi:MAG: mismatch-specific DNA-glycosylase [Actinomycetota bacterium]